MRRRLRAVHRAPVRLGVSGPPERELREVHRSALAGTDEQVLRDSRLRDRAEGLRLRHGLRGRGGGGATSTANVSISIASTIHSQRRRNALPASGPSSTQDPPSHTRAPARARNRQSRSPSGARRVRRARGGTNPQAAFPWYADAQAFFRRPAGAPLRAAAAGPRPRGAQAAEKLLGRRHDAGRDRAADDTRPACSARGRAWSPCRGRTIASAPLQLARAAWAFHEPVRAHGLGIGHVHGMHAVAALTSVDNARHRAQRFNSTGA